MIELVDFSEVYTPGKKQAKKKSTRRSGKKAKEENQVETTDNSDSKTDEA